MSRRIAKTVPRSERGAAMLAALCFASVFALCLSSYVTMCYYSLNVSNRNLGTTDAMELAESGVEDALAALNYSVNGTSINNGQWAAWTITGTTATLTESGSGQGNGASGTVVLTIANYTTSSPTITSVATITEGDGTTLSYTESTTASPAPEFINAIAATSLRVKFSAGGLVDSYNSTVGAYGGSNVGSSAVVLSQYTASSPAVVQLNNATLDGYAVTPTGTTTSYTNNAQVTAANILTNANPNQPQYNENVPGTYYQAFSSITSSTTLGYSTDTTPRCYYVWGDITLGGTSTLTIAGPVVLVCYGTITLSSTAQIVINDTKVAGNYVCSLELHAEGSLSLGGDGINNETMLPKRLALLGSYSSGDTQTISTSSPFYGVVYFPNDTVSITSNLALYGSIVATRVLISGSPSIHYDTALRSPDSNPIDAAFNCVSAPLTVAGISESLP